MPLSPPRPPSEDEARFCREQAEVYYAALKDSPFVTLLPACARCGSESVRTDMMNCTLVCNHCDYTMSTVGDLRAGRLTA